MAHSEQIDAAIRQPISNYFLLIVVTVAVLRIILRINVFIHYFKARPRPSDGARCLEVGGTRKSGLTGGLSQAPYARVCKFGLITRPIFSNSGGGTYPPDPPVAPSLPRPTACEIFSRIENRHFCRNLSSILIVHP